MVLTHAGRPVVIAVEIGSGTGKATVCSRSGGDGHSAISTRVTLQDA
jgi:hypothetical protein